MNGKLSITKPAIDNFLRCDLSKSNLDNYNYSKDQKRPLLKLWKVFTTYQDLISGLDKFFNDNDSSLLDKREGYVVFELIYEESKNKLHFRFFSPYVKNFMNAYWLLCLGLFKDIHVEDSFIMFLEYNMKVNYIVHPLYYSYQNISSLGYRNGHTNLEIDIQGNFKMANITKTSSSYSSKYKEFHRSFFANNIHYFKL